QASPGFSGGSAQDPIKAYHGRISRPLPGRPFMQRTFLASVTIALAAVSAAVVVHAQGQQPTFATTKVTDNVYYFRYQGHQSMFIVTPDGVIATDPISENRPAAEAYLAEIRKITQAPIRYVVYSHQDPDHIAGGKPFKDAGATFVAH